MSQYLIPSTRRSAKAAALESYWIRLWLTCLSGFTDSVCECDPAVTSQGYQLVDHVGAGGIQQVAVRASRMASIGRRWWLRALVRYERMRQWRCRVARVRQQPLIFAASL